VARVTNAGSAGPDHAKRSGGPSRNGRQYVGQARHLQDISTDDPRSGGRQRTTEIYREISLDGDGISHHTLGQALKKGSAKAGAASLNADLLRNDVRCVTPGNRLFTSMKYVVSGRETSSRHRVATGAVDDGGRR
jgi:hypothetical protein